MILKGKLLYVREHQVRQGDKDVTLFIYQFEGEDGSTASLTFIGEPQGSLKATTRHKPDSVAKEDLAKWIAAGQGVIGPDGLITRHGDEEKVFEIEVKAA